MGKGTGLLSPELPVQSRVPAEESGLKINAAKAIEMLNRQVEKKGADYVYPRRLWSEVANRETRADLSPDQTVCVNWILVNGKAEPDCILGHVYADWGILGQCGMTSNVHMVLRTLSRAGILLTQRAISTFHTAQQKQDNGWTWGAAVESATWHAEHCTADNDTEYLTWTHTEAF